jgi:peptidoglycan/LPS O-acetylase OafA/YrhL
MKQDLNYVHYLKAFSVIYIVGIWHMFDYTYYFPSYKNVYSLSFTYSILGLFTLVSGLLIGLSLSRSSSILPFYSKRILRIYPLYLAAVVMFFLFDLNSIWVSIKSAAFLSLFFGPAPKTLWYICMIMVLYLISPFLFRLLVRPKLFLGVSVGVIGLLCILVFGDKLLFWGLGVDYRLVWYTPCFCLGMWLSQYSLPNDKRIVIGSLFLTLVAALLTLVELDSWTLTVLADVVKYIPFILISTFTLFYTAYLAQGCLPKSRVIITLSYASFAMYLFHRPIFMTLKSLYFPDDPLMQLVFLVVLCVPIIFCLSWCVQNLADKALKLIK